MAKTNYSFEKRQRELAKQKKQEEKRQRKLAKKTNPESHPPLPEDSEQHDQEGEQ